MNLPVVRTVLPAAIFAELERVERDEQELREEAFDHLFDCFVPELRAQWLAEQRDVNDASLINDRGNEGFAADSGGDW